MNKIKALLLPLALVFAAIAIFEFGARYGASNTRAFALTSQLDNFINLYKQVGIHADDRSRAHLETVIDNHVMTAALQRNAWYLRFKTEPKASLEKILREALSIRGDALMDRLDTMQAGNSEEARQLSPTRLAEIHSAVERARNDLIIEDLPQKTAASEI